MDNLMKFYLIVIAVTAILSFSVGMIYMHNIEKDKALFYQEEYVKCKESELPWLSNGSVTTNMYDIINSSFDEKTKKIDD